MRSNSQRKKLEWFDLGAAACERQFPGAIEHQFGRGAPPMYLCPICQPLFPREAIVAGTLTAEHVPPGSFGGRELVLTCKRCNNVAGSVLDAHARKKENVADAMDGRLQHPRKVTAFARGISVNAELASTDREFRLNVPSRVNRPGAGDAFREALRNGGTEITLQFSGDAFAGFGAKISWLRSGYLLLFAVFGYSPVFDPALDIVRRQILEPYTSLTRTFTIELPDQHPWSERRLIKVLEPAWHKCWAARFGRYCVLFPLAGDKTFYDRIATRMAGRRGTIRGDSYEWPIDPIFGQPDTPPGL